MLRLTPEDTILLLTSRAYLEPPQDEHLQRLTLEEVDWAFVAWRAENNRTIPLLEHHLRRLGVLYRIPPEIRMYIQRWTTASKLRSVFEFRNLGEILDAFDRAGVACFLVKGPDLALLYYPDPLMRPMTDVDVMIDPKDAERVQQIMFGLGYGHGIFDPSNGSWSPKPSPITRDTFKESYALPVFVRIESFESPFTPQQLPRQIRYRHVKSYIDPNGVMHMPIFADLHVNLSVGIDSDDIWRGTQLAKALGRIVRVHSPTAAVWFLAARLYHEAFLYNSLRLIMMSDLQAVLLRQGSNIDWAQIVAIAFKYEMRPALFYVLSQVRRLAGAEIPDEVLALLRPEQHEIPPQHDWGDVVPKLFSIPYVNEIALA